MTQGIQFSALLTSTDSALKPATMQAPGDVVQSGFGFGAVLGELVQPATNSQSDKVLRKLPAGISLLSEASLLLPAEAEGASALQPDNSALLSDSILYQLALKDKYAPGSGNITLPPEGTALGAEGEPDNVAGDDTTDQTEQDTSVLTGATSATSARFGKRDIDKGSLVTVGNTGRIDRAEPVLPGGDKLLQVDTVDADGKTIVLQSDDDVATDVSRGIASLASAGEIPADGRFNVDRDEVKEGPVTLVNKGRVERAIPVPPDREVLLQGKNVGSAKLTGSDVGLTDRAVDELALQGAALQQDALASAGNQAATNTLTDAKSDPKTQADKAAAVSQTVAQPLTAHSGLETLTQQERPIAAEVNVGGHAAMRQPLAKTADAKADKAKSALSAVSSGVSASNLNAASVVSSAEQLAQQQQSAIGQADTPVIAAELAATVSAKTVAEQPNSKADSLFTTSLHTAQQRQQNSAIKTAGKTSAEHLKQSLNLLQHDAAGQLRERVNLMLRQNIQIAEIRLDPAGLGQMQIKVDMQQDQANVQFIVQQSQAKELLEQQLPRLREMLQQQGIVLGEGSVQQQSSQERQLADRQQQQQGQAGQHANNDDHLSDDAQVVQVQLGAADRLVDYYA